MTETSILCYSSFFLLFLQEAILYSNRNHGDVLEARLQNEESLRGIKQQQSQQLFAI